MQKWHEFLNCQHYLTKLDRYAKLSVLLFCNEFVPFPSISGSIGTALDVLCHLYYCFVHVAEGC